jgi:5-dehydro-2-deoxygluconokinase
MGRSSIDLYSNDIGSPFVEIKTFSAYVGGSSTNIAVGAQRLGLRTALLTGLGTDLTGDFILNFLKKEGVETKFIPRKSGARSSAVLLGVEPPDRFPLVFYRENAADIQLTIDDVLDTPLHWCRVFEFGGTNLSKEPSRSATMFAIERARSAATIVGVIAASGTTAHSAWLPGGFTAVDIIRDRRSQAAMAGANQCTFPTRRYISRATGADANIEAI